MNPSTEDHQPDPLPQEPPELADPQHEELKRLVLAHVKEFGPRKYLAYYAQAKNLKDSGVPPDAVRSSLVIGLPKVPPPPQGGVHFLSKVQNAKQLAIHHVVRHAVEDAIARRPSLFKEEYAELGS